jgi:hypothetical protein
MSLLLEYQDFSYKMLSEGSEDGKKKTMLKGLLQQAGVQNGNGRMYPKPILEREINKNKEKVSNRQMLGELDHPPEGKIHLDKVSHCITEIDIDESGKVNGIVEVFDGPDEEGGTPQGRILGSLVRRGVKLGISSRGFGSVKKYNGVNEVQDDFKLITFDIVADPSTPNAYPEAVYEEQEADGWYQDREEKHNLAEALNENLED